MEPWLHITFLMLVCTATFGFFFMGMHRRGVTYGRHFLWTTAYFFSVALFVAILYRERLGTLLQGDFLIPLSVFIGGMTVLGALHVLTPRILARPTSYLAQYPDRYYLDIDWKRFVSKSMDILAQQVIIILLVLLLSESGRSMGEVIPVFMLLFFLLHIPLIVSERGTWPSVLFAAIVFVFSITFPVLILMVPYGFVYTYLLHWTFYIVTALSFWIWYASHTRSYR